MAFQSLRHMLLFLNKQPTMGRLPYLFEGHRKPMLGITAKQTVVKYPGNQSCTPRYIQPSYCTNYNSTFSDTSPPPTVLGSRPGEKRGENGSFFLSGSGLGTTIAGGKRRLNH
ncbi:unnamed protein product [Fusarium venenatum]|uniref:Uncharacterized protein n=1 Tax=Fusarium venenatum TaxID=56646 RepID=A0A2L2TZY2_9HYPO|nr:LOW QUALITY PROTEIN: uncharacterized protein FVRRES_03407 [Fusarium venenatum]CEI66895.1 unnamed protein product [Fusarium venenatum]